MKPAEPWRIFITAASCRRRIRSSRLLLLLVSAACACILLKMAVTKHGSEQPTYPRSQVAIQHAGTREAANVDVIRETAHVNAVQEAANVDASQEVANVALSPITDAQWRAMEEVQRERKKRMKEFCASNNLTEPIFGKKIPDLMVDDKDKMLLCVTYKVASRQLKRIIGALTDVKIGKYAPRGLFNWFNQYPTHERVRMADTYFKFLFVREPLERLLSGFIDKFYRERHDQYRMGYGRTIIERYRENPSKESLEKGNDVKFGEFAQFILDGNRDEHWDRYYKRCHPCALEYDFIGYFEDLQGELPYALQAAGVKQVPMQIPYVSHNTSSRVQEYFSELPKQKILDLAELYSYDYGLFGYPFPGPLYTDLLKNAS